MKTITLTIEETRAVLILNEYLQAQQVDGSHRFMDYLPMIERALASISNQIVDTTWKRDTAA